MPRFLFILSGLLLWMQNIYAAEAVVKLGAGVGPAGSAVMGISLIGIGGSIVKPCIAATVQKTSGRRALLGFAVFYMIINIGTLSGRWVSYFVRTRFGLPAIFSGSAAAFTLIGLAVALFFFREPEYAGFEPGSLPDARKKTLAEAVGGIFRALKNGRFVFFLVVIGLFWALYAQIFNLMPLYMRSIDPDAPMELYTMASPVMIILFQLLVTRAMKKISIIRSIIFGVAATTGGLLLNILPGFFRTDAAHRIDIFGLALPFAGIFLVASIAAMAFGEMMASPRIYEFVGAIAPKGEEGLFLGYVNLPVALGSLVGGPLGGFLFEKFVQVPAAAGRPAQPAVMWLVVAAFGVLSMAGLVVYEKVLIHPHRGNRR